MLKKSLILLVVELICFSIVRTEEPTITYWPNGKKRSETEYKDGKKNGKDIFWYDSGVKNIEAEYKDGKRTGKHIFWNRNGIKENETEYKNDKEDGKKTSWSESGIKSCEVEYKDGKMNGKETWWNENGTKSYETEYKDGKKIKFTGWNESGIKYSEVEYKDGKSCNCQNKLNTDNIPYFFGVLTRTRIECGYYPPQCSPSYSLSFAIGSIGFRKKVSKQMYEYASSSLLSLFLFSLMLILITCSIYFIKNKLLTRKSKIITKD